MIWESWPWKKELARRAESLRKRKTQKRWSAATSAAVEQDLFIAAFAIRKLLEAAKISDEVECVPVPAVFHNPAKGRVVDLMNWHKIDQLYDLASSAPASFTLREFCNQLIHSFVFMPCMGDAGGLAGVFVTSDRVRRRRLFYFDLDAIIAVMDRVAKDDILAFVACRDARTGEMNVVKKSNRPASGGWPVGF
jgi:hypothetical protein